jgi:hypothetical protein
MYWYEGSTINTNVVKIDVLVAYATSYKQAGYSVILLCSFVFIAAFFGVCMLFLCVCFEQKHSFMEGEKLMPTTQSAKTAS